MNTSELLARNARKYPEQEAVVFQGERTTYSVLDQFVNKFGSALRQKGIHAEDKVALFLPNTPEFAVAYLAVQRIGAIVVPVNVKLTGEEVLYILEDSGAKMLIAHEMVIESVRNIESPVLKMKTGGKTGEWDSFWELLEEQKDTPIECHLKEDDLSTILYTSGTTGKPKGVLFTYRSILNVATMINIEMEVKPESRILLSMPLSHSAPLHLFFMAGLMTGSALVLTPTFTPDLFLDTIERERATHFFGAPVAYLTTMQMADPRERDLSSMEWWVYGGAPLSPKEVHAIKQAFPSGNLTCVYGLTEAGPSGTLLFDEEHKEKAGSIGHRAPWGTEIRLIDETGGSVSQGEVGEIALRGEGNMREYYRKTHETEEVFAGEWLRTGDLAMQDEDGYYWVIDRKKDMIISGGVNIYPKEIENVMLEIEGVNEAAVIGIPHPEWGETVKAVYAGAAEEEKVRSVLEKRIASYKVPRIYEQVTELPRNASGKILKQALKGGES
ncbi:class I adenylate-forming enzyme family protein [Salimicrobium jeotgali]|uniref:class I adenylate-forming enzyme family protein n=1 Tax=Salimicrobium jeotgali TaxID=1230341 RepID=UPI000C83DDA3|nr:AMP-binding protein [Salimicrobium jeotgali]